MPTNIHHSTKMIAVLLTGVFLLIFALTTGFSPFRQPTPPPATPVVAGASSVVILNTPIRLSGQKSVATQLWRLDPTLFSTRNTIKITYDLHGLCLLEGASSELALISGNPEHRYPLALADYGKNCYAGEQEVDIPLSAFPPLSPPKPSTVFLRLSLWYPTQYAVDIRRIVIYNAGSAVLGAATAPGPDVMHKTFPSLTPIRPEPFARQNLPE